MSSIDGSRIAIWEILNSRVFHSYLDSLPGYLGCSEDGHSYATRALSYLFLASIPICFLAFLRPQKDHDIQTRAALRALLTIAAPACSLWPSRYIKLASTRRSHLDLPFEMIIKDTTDGVIELRDPVNDLANLVGAGINVHGYTICITIAWKWWISCFEWWVITKSKLGYILGFSDWPDDNIPTVHLNALGFPRSLTSPTSCPLLYLDYMPHPSIPSLNVGRKMILEFTAFSPFIRTFSTAQVISAIPFISSGRSPRRPRSLVSVLKQLTASSHGSNLVVDSVSNVSADYERTLRRLYRSLSTEQKIRETWVRSLGIKVLRRDMFLVALEAALLHRGWIERWAIQVSAT